MRRFVFFAVLLAISLPVGLSTTGCSTADNGSNFCSGFQSGQQLTAPAQITLQPSVYGLSLSYGQVASLSTPTAVNCKGTSVTVKTYSFGTTSLALADVSPSGQVCGGTWNRNSGNGVPNFTTCIPPQPGSPVFGANGGLAYLTASGGGATSNPVPVFVHPPVTSVLLGGAGAVHNCPNNPSTGSPTGVPVYALNRCLSQNQTAQLAATVCTGTGACTPGSPNDITCNAGHLIFAPQNASVVSVDQNGVATAHQPGSTVINATIAQATSTAGYMFTCPAQSISLTVGTTGQKSVTVNTSNIQPLTTTILDTQGNPISGLQLLYTSNDPINIPVSNTGSVTPAYPSDAAIVAQCLPSVCNPAPQNEIGNLSAGLPISSNPVDVHTPGPSQALLYMASPQSLNLVPLDFQSGNVGTPIRLPYQPNSMVMDENGNNLFIGSSAELMIAAISPTAGTTLTSQNPGIPGTVLAVAPNDTLVVVHDPCRQLFYLYTPPIGNLAAALISFGAPGPTIACDVNSQPIDPSVEVHPPYAAQFTQDSQTVYITGDNTLYTYNTFTGWQVCTQNGQSGNCPINPSSTSPTSVAVTIPGVGAYAAGSPTTAFGYCALGPNNAAQSPGPPPIGLTDPTTGVNPKEYYPNAATVSATTDELAATTDGYHIIGATAGSGGQLTDIGVQIPDGACPLKTALNFPSSPQGFSLATPNVGSINQVLVSPNSLLAFVTFEPTSPTGGNNTLPAYKVPCTAAQSAAGNCPAGQPTTGAVDNVALTGQAGAPVGGAFSPDTTTFYVSTSQDDLLHLINTSTLTDTQTFNPGLTCATTTTAPANPYLACTAGSPVPALFIAARPRPTQGSVTTSAKKN
jgi:trimeric autotransporter adhesin